MQGVVTLERKTPHYATLDGFRGIAALVVVALHTFQVLAVPGRVHHAELAVDFFFMLSGFVVAKAYETRLKTSMSFVEFVKVRVIRLYPMIIVGVLLGAFVFGGRLITTHSITAEGLLEATVSGLLLLPTTALFSLYEGMLYPVDAPEWSLFFELTINFVYAPVVRLLTTRKLICLCILSGAALVFVARSYGDLRVGYDANNFFAGFARVAFPFLMGVLLLRWRPRFHLHQGVGVFLGFALLAVLIGPDREKLWSYDLLAVGVLFPAIIVIGSVCESGKLLNGLWLWLGELSYPLYITHFPMVRLIKNAALMLHLNLNPVTGFFACAAGSVIRRGYLFCRLGSAHSPVFRPGSLCETCVLILRVRRCGASSLIC